VSVAPRAALPGHGCRASSRLRHEWRPRTHEPRYATSSIAPRSFSPWVERPRAPELHGLHRSTYEPCFLKQTGAPCRSPRPCPHTFAPSCSLRPFPSHPKPTGQLSSALAPGASTPFNAEHRSLGPNSAGFSIAPEASAAFHWSAAVPRAALHGLPDAPALNASHRAPTPSTERCHAPSLKVLHEASSRTETLEAMTPQTFRVLHWSAVASLALQGLHHTNGFASRSALCCAPICPPRP
jgi:hypothetical protein